MKSNFKKALFFDRDGVINKLVKNRPPWLKREISIFFDIKKIISLCIKKEYLPVVVTNQPDAGRGKLKYELLHEINNFICQAVNIDNFYICDHPYDGICDCRKPKPGMLLNASKDLCISLSNSFIIGDRQKDIDAGIAAGCKTIYLSKEDYEKADYNVKTHLELYQLLNKIL